jgi:hypothetical protein
MVGRLSVACVSLLAVLAFLLLFGSGSEVNAATYKMTYATYFSCNGPDGVYGTSDDSCVEDGTYGAFGAGLHADLVSDFGVSACGDGVDQDGDTVADDGCGSGYPAAVGTSEKSIYSQYETLTTMGTPSTWEIATDKEIPDGAYIGTVLAQSTLALFGGECNTALPVLFKMYDCSTDITDTIAWSEADSGMNLVLGHEGGLPAGCLHYPQHVLDIVGNVKPRARYFGFTTVLVGMPPTQLQFMMFSTEALTAAGVLPQTDFTDDLGYINYTVLDNPSVPSEGDSALDELCTPLATTTTLYGLTGGQGGLDLDVLTVGDVPEDAGTFWNVGTEICGNAIDDDADTSVDEMCGIVRVTNPAVGTGIYGTSTHLAGGYSQSYRDADGDTIPNNADECPYTFDTGTDTDGDHIDDACDPTNSPGPLADEDGDDWRNQADNCPLVAQTSQANDADDDNIGDECDTAPSTPDGDFLQDFAVGAVCIGDDDFDGDGWCDDTENIMGHGSEVLSLWNDGNSTPEYIGTDFSVTNDRDGDTVADAAPQTCDNYTYYDVTSGNPHGGVAPATDDDGDTVVNGADPNCAAIAGDADQDGVPDGSDNCPNVANPTQLNTDGDAQGDACDSDDDQDKTTDVNEWAAGSDPKNVCDPANFDLNTTPASVGVINILDVLMFSNAIMNQPCNPPDNYLICEATYRSNQ